MMARPESHEYQGYFERYIAYVGDEDILAVMADQIDEVARVFGSLSTEKQHFRYAADKWTVLEVLGHMLDSERVFGFRALSFARGEQASLPGFDEQAYMLHANHNDTALEQLLEEFVYTRKSHVLMFDHLKPDAWLRVGTANNNAISVRALAFIMVGHIRHHLTILNERYGLKISTSQS